MGVVAIGVLLSLTLGRQQVIIMVISMILDDGNLKFQKNMLAWCKITKSLPSFSIHHGKAIFLVATHPVCYFLSLQHFQSALLHQGRLWRERIIEKEPDLMEISLGQMNVMAWWESNRTRLRTRTIL
jgi:hypothetical protein